MHSSVCHGITFQTKKSSAHEPFDLMLARLEQSATTDLPSVIAQMNGKAALCRQGRRRSLLPAPKTTMLPVLDPRQAMELMAMVKDIQVRQLSQGHTGRCAGEQACRHLQSCEGKSRPVVVSLGYARHQKARACAAPVGLVGRLERCKQLSLRALQGLSRLIDSLALA